MSLNNTSSHPVKKLEESMLIASEQIISFDHGFPIAAKAATLQYSLCKKVGGISDREHSFCKLQNVPSK